MNRTSSSTVIITAAIFLSYVIGLIEWIFISEKIYVKNEIVGWTIVSFALGIATVSTVVIICLLFSCILNTFCGVRNIRDIWKDFMNSIRNVFKRHEVNVVNLVPTDPNIIVIARTF